MKSYVFLPMSEELLEQHPELMTAPIVPFDLSFPCFRILEEENQAENQGSSEES